MQLVRFYKKVFHAFHGDNVSRETCYLVKHSTQNQGFSAKKEKVFHIEKKEKCFT